MYESRQKEGKGKLRKKDERRQKIEDIYGIQKERKKEKQK